MASLFYDGDLQSGIALALKDSKSVVCFIRDDGEESSQWENDYLVDAQIKAALTANAITLSIKAGSQEHGFLKAYYPVSETPALIIIHNGQLTLDLRSGQDKAAFKSGVLTTLIAVSTEPSTTHSASEGSAASNSEEDSTSPPSTQGQPTVIAQTSTSPSSEASPSRHPTQESPRSDPSPLGSRQSSAVENLLQERRRRLEIQKKQQDAAEKAARSAKSDARTEAMTAAPDSAKAKQASYAQQQKKRLAEARLERDRVLRQIEQDKTDRKEREERRKALARAEAEGKGNKGADAGNAKGKAPDDSHPVGRFGNGNEPVVERKDVKSEPLSKDCAVQVRLFDGSTIRAKFKKDQTLTHIRKWIDEERSDDVPYTFKQILSPLPNRSLTISEEKDDLRQLGFLPTCTLVIVPIKGYTAAYADAGPSIVSRGVSAGYNTVAAGAGMISRALGTFLRFGQAVPQPTESGAQTTASTNSEPPLAGSEPGINIRTLRDQRERDEGNDHQLYNGNQINVQPRNDDIEKDE